MSLLRIINRARLRCLAGRILHGAGVGLVVGLAASLVTLLADRLAGGLLPWPVYPALAAAGAVVGGVLCLRRRPGRLEVAFDLDQALGLQDRLSSGLAMEQPDDRGRRADPVFAAMVRRDAERTAGRIDVPAATPIRAGGEWVTAAVLAVVLLLGALFVPPVTARDDGDRAVDEEMLARRQAERQEVATAIEAAVDEIADEPGLDESIQEELASLDDLSRQLTGDDAATAPDAARREATARLQDLADRVAEQAERDRAATEQLQRRFGGLEDPEAPMSAEAFREALRRGDFGIAADELDRLLEESDRMSQEQRRETGEALRSIGDELEETAAAGDAGEPDERAAQLEQVLRDQSVDETTLDELLNGPPAGTEEIEQALREEGLDEELVPDLARDLEALRREQEAQEQARQDAGSIAEALDEAADTLERPPVDPGEPPPPAPGSEPAPSEPPPAGPETPQTPEPSPPAGEQPPDGEQSPDGEPQEAPQQPGEQPPPTGQPQQQPQSTPSQSPEPGAAPEPRPGEQTPQTPEAPQAAPAPSEPTAEDQPSGQQPEPGSGEPTVPPQAQPSPQASPQDQQPPDSGRPSMPQPSPDGAPGQEQIPSRVLREMAQRQNDAQQGEALEQRLREAARRMAESGDEEQRRRWAEQWTRQESGEGDDPGDAPGLLQDSGDPGWSPQDLEPLDLAGPETPQETVAQWLSDEELPSGAPTGDGTSRAQRVRAAQQVAERAVNEAVVPNRYHRFIKRYFDRLQETVDRAATEPAPDPSPAAPDS